VLVVEKFEWQTSEGRIDGACPAWRCKATRREQQQVPSQKEAEPSEETPDEGGRWREGEIGAQVSRDILKNFAMGFDCGLTSSQGLTRWKASWVSGTFILNRVGGNELLGLRIRTVARVVRRVTRQLIGRHGADSAVSGDDSAEA
jgi:hypothetical protein